MSRNSRLPSAPVMGESMTSSCCAAQLCDAGPDAVDGELVGGGIAHDAALADVLAAGFELRLDEEDGFDSRAEPSRPPRGPQAEPAWRR